MKFMICLTGDSFDRMACCETASSCVAAEIDARHKNHYEKFVSSAEDLAYVAIYKNGYRTMKYACPLSIVL